MVPHLRDRRLFAQEESCAYLSYLPYIPYLPFPERCVPAAAIFHTFSFSFITYHCCAMPNSVEAPQYMETADGNLIAKKPIISGMT